jgi:ferrous iron transport protein B
MSSQTLNPLPLIALVGPPNSGKTSLFNFLSGKSYKTVNYPGATVEYSVSRMLSRFKLHAHVLDSPGIVSLIANSPDEQISIDSLYNYPDLGSPDVIIATVDASQLSRHLLLVNQLIESGFNIIIALTMTDMLKKKGFYISAEKLSGHLNAKVVIVDGRTGKGTDELVAAIDENLNSVKNNGKIKPKVFGKNIELESLINSYKNIERIEHDSIIALPSNGNPINLEAANKQLKVLSSPAGNSTANNIDNYTLKIDKILLHPFWGIFSFFIIMALTFSSIFWLADPLMGMVDEMFAFLSGAAGDILGYGWFGDLVANGLIAGTGSVLVFIPQIIILFLILGILEDTGYLARGAMLIDKPLSKIGLNGRSFVPMLSGFACAIPAIMAARTIPNKKERLLTIFIIPLMSCSARLPVYALLIAFLLPSDKLWMGGLLLAAIYIFSITSSIIVAGIVNKFKNKLIKEEDNSSFILELPSYRSPKLSSVLLNTYNSTKLYVQKAGPVILFFSLALWFLTYFPNSNPQFDETNLTETEIAEMVTAERLSGSYAADLGKIIQPVMTPIGMDWRIGVALIASFAAREVFVSSMALIFKVTDSGDEDSFQASLLNAMRDARIDSTGEKLFTTSTIIGLIIFFVFALQCMSTIAVSRKETGGWRIPILQLIMFTSIAYLFTFIAVNGLKALGIS